VTLVTAIGGNFFRDGIESHLVPDRQSLAMSRAAGGNQASRDAKKKLFEQGDPDLPGEVAEFTEFASLQIPGRPEQAGIVRILCNVAERYFRLLMRDVSGCAIVLNHYLMPDLVPVADGNSITYRAVDYANPAQPESLEIKLTFDDEVTRDYFTSKCELAMWQNQQLLASRSS